MAANTEGVASSHPPHLRLEPPGEIPSPPVSNASKYTVDVFERVVRADFSRDERLDPLDEAYVLGLFERPDLTVIVKGLAKRLDPTIWNTRYLAERCGTVMYHNFRRFCCGEEDPGGAFVAIPEVEKAWSSMRLCDYVRYLDQRAEAARNRAASKSSLSSPPGAPSVDSSSSTRTPSESSSSTRAPSADQAAAPPARSTASKKPASPRAGRRGASSSNVSTSAGVGGGGVPPQASPEEEPTSPDSAAAAAAAAGAPAGVDGAAAAAAAAADSSSSFGALGSASTPTIAANRASEADSDVTRANQGGEHNASMENGNSGNPGGGISGGHGIGGVDEGGGDVEGGEGGRGRVEIEPSMKFTSFDGKPRTVNLLRESVYLTDMDLTRYLPECANNLGREFMMDIMPGGSTCAMQYMPRESRPFLGPNLYITPPGSWTHFHQDGNGTVDSGHQCLAGRNRVIMLRRLDEDNKRRALRILAGDHDLGTNSSGGAGAGAAVPDVRRGDEMLYKLPHGPGQKPPWPSEAAIDRLRELNFCPSVFTLEPGEFVHIGKGRLHAFRKEAPLANQDPGSVCVSVAWDWVFQGVTMAGRKEELSYALRCADDNRRAQASSLAPVETCLVQAAKASLASLRVRSSLLGVGKAPFHTSVDNANGSARGAAAAALSDPSDGAIVAQAGVLRRRQSSTPRPPLSTSPPSSSSAPLPVLELLSRLQDLLPSEVATEYVRAAGRNHRSLSASSSPGVPTGLGSWIMPHSPQNCGVFDDDDSGKAETKPILGCTSLRSSALGVAIAAAREVLETGAPAAREAEARAKASEAQAEATVSMMLTNAAKVCGGVSPASGSCSAHSASASASAACSAAGRSAMAAARMASEAVAAAVNAAAAAAPGVMGEAEMLSALAPLLEEIVARQRREWDVQAKATEDSEKPPVLDPSRPGKRKLGPAAAKARDDAIVAVMQKMERPIKRAVDVVEVDSSVPMHLQKINPFSGDDGFSCSSCHTELFNAYMHCYGCEVLLGKDLNLCLGCHASGRLAFPPLGEDELGLTDRLHCPSIPEATLLQRELKAVGHRNSGQWPASRCGCHQQSCRQCHLCVLCACDCHHRFQLRFRFEHPEHLERFVVSVRDAAGGDSTFPQHLSHHRHDALGDGRGGGGSGSGSSTGGGKGLDKSDPGNAVERSRNNGKSSSSSERRNSGSGGGGGGESGGSVESTSEESRAGRTGETASSASAPDGGGGGVNVEHTSVSPPEVGEGEAGDGETAANASEQTHEDYRRRHRGHGAGSQSRGQGRVRGGANNSRGDLVSSDDDDEDDNDTGDGDSESSDEAAGDIPGAVATKATSAMRSKAGSSSSSISINSESGGSGSSGSGSSSENDGEVSMLREGGKRQGGAPGDSDSTSAGAVESPLSRGSAPSSGAEGRIAGDSGGNRSASVAAEKIRRRKRKRKSVDGGGDGAPDRSDDGYDSVYDDVIPRFRDPVERDNSYWSASGRGRAKTSSASAGRGKNVSGASVGRKARKVSIDGGSAAVRVALVEEGGGGGEKSFADDGSNRRLDKACVSVSSPSSASVFSEGIATVERRKGGGSHGGAKGGRSFSEDYIPRGVVGKIDGPRRSGGGSSSDPELEAFTGEIDTPGRSEFIIGDRGGDEEPGVSARGGKGNGSERARAEASATSALDVVTTATGGGVVRDGGGSKKEGRGGESGNLRAPAGIMPLVAGESGRRVSAAGKKRKNSAGAGIADGVDADGERYFAAANVSVPAGGKRRRVERVGSAAEVLASGESGGGGGDGGFFVTGWEKGVEAEFAEGRRSSSSRAEESVGDPRATKRV